MERKSRILITGANGVIGTALKEYLLKQGYENVFTPSSTTCDLVNKLECEKYMDKVKPEYVFHMAGRVYGLGGNSLYRAKAIYENLMINTNVIHATAMNNVKKIVAMGTVAMYPDPAISSPAKETDLWGGYPHESEQSYAVAKLTMLATLDAYKHSHNLDFAVALSTNLYGPNDRFNDETGHVIPSLIKKFHTAHLSKTPVEIWGTGIAERDFLYSDDAAIGLVSIMEQITGPVNLVSGTVVKIKSIIEILSEITGVKDIQWDSSKPDGQLVRSYDSSKLSEIGFVPNVDLRNGLQRTWEWYSNNLAKIRV